MVFNDVILEDCNGKVYVCTFLTVFERTIGVSRAVRSVNPG